MFERRSTTTWKIDRLWFAKNNNNNRKFRSYTVFWRLRWNTMNIPYDLGSKYCVFFFRLCIMLSTALRMRHISYYWFSSTEYDIGFSKPGLLKSSIHSIYGFITLMCSWIFQDFNDFFSPFNLKSKNGSRGSMGLLCSSVLNNQFF